MQFSLLLFYSAPVFTCDFEDGLCFNWKQDTYDDTDWTLANGTTASGGTGPSKDHTKGTRKYY